MLRPYVEALRLPGALAFSASALVARMPISMLSLGIVLAIEPAMGAYGPAGLVAGAALVGQAAATPFQARAADRIGQTRMLVPLLAAHVISLGTLVALIGHTTAAVLASVGLVVGTTLPQIGSLVRARWAFIQADSDRLHTAYALESAVDEFVFLAGWPLVTVLATAVQPVAGLIACLALTSLGCAALATQRGTDPGPRPAATPGSRAQPLASATPGWLVLAFLLLGGVFGSIHVTTVAFADQAGASGATGPILAVFALGSLLAGLATGAIRWRIGLRPRFAAGVAALTLAVLPLTLVRSVPLLGILLFVAAFAIAPTLAAGFSLVKEGVPAARTTEGLAWAFTALTAGKALGSAAAGSAIDRYGASSAYVLSFTCGALATAVCAAGWLQERQPVRQRG
ncbi:MAG TPA: MFS transporter [Jiangellaceae bacterium]